MVIDALNVAYAAWRNTNGVDVESVTMMDKTHRLVIDYIESLLGNQQTIPLISK